MKDYRRVIVVVLCFLSISVFAQKNELGAWYMYFGNNKISDRFNFHNEIQYRNFDAGTDLEQLLIRTGIGYDLTENNNNVLVGYGFVLSKPYINGEKSENIEHRLFPLTIKKCCLKHGMLRHIMRFSCISTALFLIETAFMEQLAL